MRPLPVTGMRPRQTSTRIIRIILNHPIAVFNMGATYHHDGDVNKADNMFSDAVIRGRGYEPDLTLEPASAGTTVSEHACVRLHRDNQVTQIAVIRSSPL